MPKKAVLSAAVTGLVAQTLPALAVVRAPARQNQPSENHAKNRVEKFTPLTTLPFRFIQVDERLNGDGTGLIFGINDESLGFILLTVPTLIFGLYYVANTTDGNIMAGGKDDDSGLSL